MPAINQKSETLLEIKNLSVTFRGAYSDFAAVKNISFSLNRGEMVGLVGESGSGKSVTALSILKLISGNHVSYPSGSISFSNKALLKSTEKELQKIRGRKIAMIFQEPMTSLNPLHIIGSQLDEAITLHQTLSKKQRVSRIHELLEMVGLKDFKHRLDSYPHQLSGGQRQRIMIAMALANNPELLIADEPTTALDVTIQAGILKLLKELQEKLSMSVLLITHDLTLVRKFTSRVVIMKEGEIVEQGNTEEVFSAPKAAYSRKLIGSALTSEPVNFSLAEILLEAKNVNVYFKIGKKKIFQKEKSIQAVKNFSIKIEAGQTVGVVGESGSGKTTSALALLRLVKSNGDIFFLNNKISNFNYAKMRPLRRDLQIVFQDPFASLNPRMTVFQIISEGLLAHNLKKNEIENSVRAALKEVALPETALLKYPHEFSGGQRQRIAIARALVLRPKLIVLDEPTSALDLTTQSEILTLLKDIQAKHKISYLFISHDLRVIKSICHRVLVMKDGEIIEEGNRDDIFHTPKEAYTQRLFGAAFLSA